MRSGKAERGLGDTRSLPAATRTLLGPAVRRARRELQWRAHGLDFRVRPGSAEDFPHTVAHHTTPLIRPLSGLDLGHNVVCRREFDASRDLVADCPVAENHALLMYQPFLPAAPPAAASGGSVD